MGRKSSITKLPPDIREWVEQLIRNGRTIDDIVAHLKTMDADLPVSRSSVGRFKQNYEASLARYRDAQAVAGQWVTVFRESPESDVGALIAEMLKTLAFQTMSSMGEDEKTPVDPQSLMFLGKAIRDVISATSINEDRIAKAVARALQKAATAAEGLARRAGLSAEMIQQFRREILGIT